MIKIRRAKDTDFEAIWDIFHQVVKKGDTFAFDPESNKAECKSLVDVASCPYVCC